MTDAYTRVRKELTALILGSGVSDFTEKDIHCTGRACEASAWFALNGKQLCELALYLRGAAPALVGEVRVAGRRLEFGFSQTFYDETLENLQGEAPMPEHVGDPVTYAYARMRMLSRKGGQGVPEAMKPVFWRALGLGEQGIGKSALEHRLRLTAREALSVGQGLGIRQRDALLGVCGPAAAGVAKLMYWAMPK